MINCIWLRMEIYEINSVDWRKLQYPVRTESISELMVHSLVE